MLSLFFIDENVLSISIEPSMNHSMDNSHVNISATHTIVTNDRYDFLIIIQK